MAEADRLAYWGMRSRKGSCPIEGRLLVILHSLAMLLTYLLCPTAWREGNGRIIINRYGDNGGGGDGGDDGGGNNGTVVMHDGSGVCMCVWSKREVEIESLSKKI